MPSSPSLPLWIAVLGTLGVGGLFGTVATLLFTAYQQHKYWIKDNKKQEWRELISTLSQSVHNMLEFGSYGLTVVSGEQEKAIAEANAEARRVIEDRIFIAGQMQRGNVLERWQLLAAEHNLSRLVDYWNHLHSDLLAAAHKDFDIKDK